jgi:death-on-curing family protein
LSRKIESVRTLAQSAQIDIDEALILLWDGGFDWINDPKDRLGASDLKRAGEVLSISSGGEEAKIAWWLSHTGLSFEEFSERAGALDIFLTLSMRKLPKGALKKLRREFRELIPVTEEEGEESYSQVDAPPFVWEQIGTTTPRSFLTEEDVEGFHDALVNDFSETSDPISPPGIRSRDLLSSALSRPLTRYAEESKYQTIEMAGAALLHSIIHNRAFFNGNKRTAFLSLPVFLDLNRTFLNCSEDEQFKFLVRVGSHNLVPEVYDTTLPDREVLEIAKWIKLHTRPVEHGERAMSWLKLKQLLASYDCTFVVQPGNRIEIRRHVARSGTIRKTSVLRSKASYASDGTDVQRSAIHKIRRELQLDEDHGIDSFAFYVGEPVDVFIVQYRGILRRLAKV